VIGSASIAHGAGGRSIDSSGSRVVLSILALLALCAAGTGCARAAEPGGAVLYARHCASCHGPEGRGDGPVAGALRTAPTDLTGIARRSGGRFDEREVMRSIDGRRHIEAHGTRDMPVWGAVFEEQLSEEPYGSLTTLLHGKSLTEYLSGIQEP
jgi:mono/diheme cytochrome c family protein